MTLDPRSKAHIAPVDHLILDFFHNGVPLSNSQYIDRQMHGMAKRQLHKLIEN